MIELMTYLHNPKKNLLISKLLLVKVNFEYLVFLHSGGSEILGSMTYEQSAPPMLEGHAQTQIPFPTYSNRPKTQGV
jgi:hypothetical protein